MIRTPLRLGAALLIGTLALSSTAMAVSITNRSATPQEVTITARDDAETVVLQPSATRDDLCAAPAGCVMSHVSGGWLALKGTEKVNVDDNGLSTAE